MSSGNEKIVMMNDVVKDSTRMLVENLGIIEIYRYRRIDGFLF